MLGTSTYLLAFFLRLQDVTSKKMAQRARVAQWRDRISTKTTLGAQGRLPENGKLFGFRDGSGLASGPLKYSMTSSQHSTLHSKQETNPDILQLSSWD